MIPTKKNQKLKKSNAAFITLTYFPKNYTPHTIESDVKTFLNEFEKQVAKPIYWLYLLEPHKEKNGGGWHVHMIVFWENGTPLPQNSEHCQLVKGLWNHGKTFCKRVWSKEIIQYLTSDKGRFHMYPAGLKIGYTSSDKSSEDY
jgi:hypothetical protein